MQASIELRLLGPACLIRADGRVLRLEGAVAGLVALLAVEGPMARSECSARLWPLVAPTVANANLRQSRMRLRDAAGHPVVESGDPLHLAAGVVLHPSLDWVDATPEDLRAGKVLLEGQEFAHSEPMQLWLTQQRDALEKRRVQALAALAAQHESQGELAMAIACVEALVELESLSEQRWRWLMRLHALRGDRAAGIAVFERMEAHLATELGTRPDAESRSMLSLFTAMQAPGAAMPAGRRPLPASLRRPPRLVGREKVLARMASWWAAGQPFALVGEAGIGKSRLLEEMCAAKPGTLHVKARHGDDAVPFAVLARLLLALAPAPAAGPASGTDVARPPAVVAPAPGLAGLLPELAHAGGAAGAAQRAQIQRAVEAELRAARDRGIHGLLLDDLHLADAASLDVLGALLSAGSAHTQSWAFAARRQPGPAALDTLRSALQAEAQLAELPLGPLDAEGLRELLHSLALPGLDADAMAPQLARHTGGNPLLALHTLREVLMAGTPAAAALPRPQNVDALMAARLKLLSPAALDLARVAAAAGPDFDIALAEQVLGQPALRMADAWFELEETQVFLGAGFAHDLMLEAVVAGVPGPIARHLHAAIARALAQRQDPPADPARLAAHWNRAGCWAEAATAFKQAADAARRTWRREDESRLLDQGIEAATAAGLADEAFEMATRRVEALRVSAGAAVSVPAAQNLLQQARTPGQRLRALLVMADNQSFANDGVNSLATAREAESLARELGDPPALFDALGLGATALVIQGQFAAASEALREVQGLMGSQPSASARYRVHALHGFVLQVGGTPRAARDVLKLALQDARAIGEGAELHMSTSNLAMVHLSLGEAHEALALAREAAALSAAMEGAAGLRCIDALNVAMTLVAVGLYGEALPLLESIERAPPGTADVWSDHAATLLAAVWLRLGQPARAQPLLVELGPQVPAAARSSRAIVRLEYAQMRGRLDPAEVARALEDAARGGNRQNVSRLRLLHAQAVGPHAAQTTAAEVMDEARRAEIPVQEAVARIVWAQASMTLGQALDAQVLHEARHLLRKVDSAWVYKPALWLDLARCFDAAGHTDAATEVLDEARTWLMDTVRPGLPEPLRESFRVRNAVNEAILNRPVRH